MDLLPRTRASAVDPRGPCDAVVDHSPTECVQILAFLEHFRGHEDEREAGHAELRHNPLVHATGHAGHRHLVLECTAEDLGKVRQRGALHLVEVDGDQRVECCGGLRQFTEGVESRLLVEGNPLSLRNNPSTLPTVRLCFLSDDIFYIE